jgi:hypothetical protein
MSALRRKCALMEELICFFTSRARVRTHGDTVYCETRNCVKTFLKFGDFSREATAARISKGRASGFR